MYLMEEKKKSKEIDIIPLVITVLKEWKTLLKFLSVAAIVGVIVALATPREYTSEVILAPELSSGGIGMAGNLADLASNFGIDLGKKSSMDAIYPELYPDIFSSTEFVLHLFNVPVRLKDDSTTKTYLEHFLKDTKIPFWEYPKAWLINLFKKPETPGKGKSEKDPYRLSQIDSDICKKIIGSMLCVIDKKTSEITITFTDQDPMVAAIMADTLQHRLQAYITDYRTKKARVDFEFYKKMTIESKKQYEKAQRDYALFADSNTDLLLQSYKSKEEQLENEMQLQYNVYNQMSSQMKAAEARVQERTPAFTIIQNAYMPSKPSNHRSMKVYLFILLGIIADAVWVLYRSKITAFIRKQQHS